MNDIRQSTQYAKYLSEIDWIVENHAGTNYFIKRIPIIGSVLKIQRPDEIRIGKIKELAKNHRAFQIIIEPKTELDAKYLASIGFRLSKNPYLPTKTLYLDLTKSSQSIFRYFKKDCRYAIRKNKKVKIVNHEFGELAKFREAWKHAIGWKRYVPPLEHLKALKKSFKKDSLFLTTNDGSSGAIFLQADGIGYYWQAFTNDKGRKSLYQYKIVWEGILWAKKKGAKIFDFEGIYDERFPNKSWLGFTHFKKSFGDNGISYPGCFVRYNIFLHNAL